MGEIENQVSLHVQLDSSIFLFLLVGMQDNWNADDG